MGWTSQLTLRKYYKYRFSISPKSFDNDGGVLYELSKLIYSIGCITE